MEDKYYSVNQIMEMFDCSRSMVNTWFEKGLPKIKLGKLTRVKERDLNKFIKELEEVNDN